MTPEEWSEIQAALHVVLELAPGDRSAYLDKRYRDATMRKEVESYLSRYECIGNFLEPRSLEHVRKTPISWTGQMAGVYRISEELGRGGMGVVYKAEDTSLLRTVALKFLPDDVTHRPSALGRFVREARAASALNHPNICTIYEVGETESHPFIAMEFVEGQPLSELIGEGGLPSGVAAGYGLQIADALAHAHQRGIIHRDLKPSNVMVTPEGRVKVLDFGLAKRLGSEAAGDDLLTQHGTLLGTPAYMAPEALRCETTDARADIWSLGMILYQAAAGKLPFQGKSRLGLFDAILREPITPLPARVPAQLRAIAGRCLQKQPTNRYQDAAEVRADLEQWRSNTKQRPVWVSLRGLILLTATLIALFTLTSTRLRYWRPGSGLPAERTVAVLPYVNAMGTREGQAFCDGMQQTVATLLGELEPSHKSLHVIPISELRPQNLNGVGAAAHDLGVNLVLTGKVEREKGLIRITTEVIDAKSSRALRTRTQILGSGAVISFQAEAIQVAADLLQIDLRPADNAVLAAGGSSREGAYEHFLIGRGYLDRHDVPGNIELSIQQFRTAIAEDPGYALAYADLAEAYRFKHAETKDTQWLEQAEETARKAIEMDHNIALAHVTLGGIYSAAGQTDAAIAEFRTALRLNPVAIAAYHDLAKAYENSGQVKLAEETYIKAAQMRPNDWMTLTMLGTFYSNQGLVAEAEPIFEQVTRLIPDSQLAFTNLGALHRAMDRYAEALRDYRRSIAIRPTARGYLGMAATYFDQRKFAESAEFNEKAVALTGDTSYTALGNLAQSYQWTPRLAAKASAAYQRAIAAVDRALATNPKDSFALSCRAVYQSQLKKHREAVKDVEEAFALAPTDVRVAVHGAIVYERSGDRVHALRAISGAISHKATAAAIAHEPDLEDLQKDSQYQKLYLTKSPVF